MTKMRRHMFHDLGIREANVKTESLSSIVRSWLWSSVIRKILNIFLKRHLKKEGLGCCDHQGYRDHGNDKSANFSSNEASEGSCAREKISGTISEEVETSVEFTPDRTPSPDNARHDELVSRLPPQPRAQMTTKINGVLQDVQWCVEDCDMLVQVEHTVFPVQRHFVAMVSEYFRRVADMMQQKHVTAVLGGFEGAEIETVLKHIYNTNGTEITDSNVASLLQLARQFGVARLQHQCEMHLLHSITFNMLIALQLARRYRLEKVMRHACQKLSLQEDFEETAEFASLDKSTQNLVLRYALKRCKQAKSAIYDVYTCPRHCGNSKGAAGHDHLHDGLTSHDHLHDGVTSDDQLCDSGVLFDEQLRDGISSNEYSSNDIFPKSDKTVIKKDSNNQSCENFDPQNIGCSADKDHEKLRNNSCCFRTASYTLSDGCKEKNSLVEIFDGAFQETPHIEVEWT